MVRGGPGRAGNGNFDLTDFSVTAVPFGEKPVKPVAGVGKGTAATSTAVPLCNPRARRSSKRGCRSARRLTAIRIRVGPSIRSSAALRQRFTTATIGFAGGTLLTFTLKFNGNDRRDLGRLRISIRRGAPPTELLGPSIAEPLLAAVALPTEKRSPQQTAAVLAWYRTIDPEWQKLNRDGSMNILAKAPKPQTTRVFVCKRGLDAR